MDEKFSLTLSSDGADLSEELSTSTEVFFLQPYDLISVRPDPYFNYQSQVTITGEVLYPGQYVILKSDEKISDIIERAGGILPNAYLFGSQFSRGGESVKVSLDKLMKNPKSKLNFNVQNGDLIQIIRRPNIVRIEGEVNSPGTYKHLNGKRLKYYLVSAGGINPDADKRFTISDSGNVGIKTDNVFGNALFVSGGVVGSGVAIGTTQAASAVDFKDAGQGLTGVNANRMYMLPPQVTTAQRAALTGVIAGAVIFWTTGSKLQVYLSDGGPYNVSNWVNLH